MTTVIKKIAIDLRIRAGYGAAFILLLLSFLLTLYANSELLKQARLVDRSNKIIIQMESMLSTLKDAEPSRKITDSLLGALETETLDDTAILKGITTLRRLVDKNYQLTDTGRSKNFFRAAIMSHISSMVINMQAIEQSRLKSRLEEMTTRYNILNAIVILSLTLAVSLAAYGYFTYSSENKARRIADQKVTVYQGQLKQQIAELDKANKALIQMRSIEKFAATGRIARTIAHEVRNPLTNINLAVDQLKSDFDGDLPESFGIMLEMISRNSVRINQLITDLLHSTKFTELVYKKVSVNDLLDETLDLAKDRVTLNNITVIKYYSDDICDIAVDIERIKIAFLNIIVNAIEAMEPGKGILQVKTISKDDKCVVTITDNGPGIDPEAQAKLFEPYYSTKPKGTGLGLTNTQNIILNHNGHISLESAKGKGASFTVSLDFA